MSGAEIQTITGGRYWVVCREHGLNRSVATETHAENLRRLHDRIDHPPEPVEDHITDLDMAAAAYALVEETLTEGQGTALEGAAAVWAALTGLTEDEALTFAREIVAAGTPLTAHLTPF